MVAADGGERYCRACRHNRTIPDISDPLRHRLWQKIEDAKRRLFYSLIRLDLPTPTVASGDPEPLLFDFLAEPEADGLHVVTGHNSGLITISLSEADDAARERIRAQMGEPYRTLLGHFRHEVGHFYWDRLVRDTPAIDACRGLFGDERADYGAALQRHYAAGPPADWMASYVSAYATSHAWEDWAETFAHYLHIVDTLEMGRAVGLRVSLEKRAQPTAIAFDPYSAGDVGELIDAWVPVSIAANSLNRAMGQPDLYPFVLSPAVIGKLGLVHALVHRRV
jgi:hypothetical protein